MAMALSSGADAIEAAVVVGDEPSANAISNIREISPKALVWYVAHDGDAHAL
jgi:DhnA family fructose-bisphosphate aldolase class Ia